MTTKPARMPHNSSALQANGDGGALGGSNGEQADYSHVKVEFLQFTMDEMRFDSETGRDQSWVVTLDDLATKKPVSKMRLKLGDEEFDVATGGTLTFLFAKMAELRSASGTPSARSGSSASRPVAACGPSSARPL